LSFGFRDVTKIRKVEPTLAADPPLSTSDAAQQHAPNLYHNSKLTHNKIVSVRAKSKLARDKQAGIYVRGQLSILYAWSRELANVHYAVIQPAACNATLCAVGSI
jgi:hypothetical protein